jgi:hypothetical protein
MGGFGGYVLGTYNRVPGDYEVVDVGTDIVTLSATKIKPQSGSYANKSAFAALLSLETADIRFRLDGGQPSGTDGHYLTSGDSLVLTGTQALKQFQAIRAGSTNGTLRVTYFY